MGHWSYRDNQRIRWRHWVSIRGPRIRPFASGRSLPNRYTSKGSYRDHRARHCDEYGTHCSIHLETPTTLHGNRWKVVVDIQISWSVKGITTHRICAISIEHEVAKLALQELYRLCCPFGQCCCEQHNIPYVAFRPRKPLLPNFMSFR